MQLYIHCRRILYAILVLFIAQTTTAQTHIPRTNVTVGAKCNGYYEYLPAGYDSNATTTYPLIVFLAGIGEMGDGTPAEINRVLVHEIPKLPSALGLERVEVGAATQEQSLLGASVHPNPSANVFNLRVRGGSLGEPVTLRVWDVAGRIVEQRTGLTSGAALSMGAAWGTGLYYAELTQGTQKVTLKLIKNK